MSLIIGVSRKGSPDRPERGCAPTFAAPVSISVEVSTSPKPLPPIMAQLIVMWLSLLRRLVWASAALLVSRDFECNSAVCTEMGGPGAHALNEDCLA
jgi:hypothetical protein